MSFSVSAQGNPTPTYQWRRDGTNLAGRTSATLTIDPVAADDGGIYDVLVSNVCDTIGSLDATLTVARRAWPGSR